MRQQQPSRLANRSPSRRRERAHVLRGCHRAGVAETVLDLRHERSRRPDQARRRMPQVVQPRRRQIHLPNQGRVPAAGPARVGQPPGVVADRARALYGCSSGVDVRVTVDRTPTARHADEIVATPRWPSGYGSASGARTRCPACQRHGAPSRTRLIGPRFRTTVAANQTMSDAPPEAAESPPVAAGVSGSGGGCPAMCDWRHVSARGATKPASCAVRRTGDHQRRIGARPGRRGDAATCRRPSTCSPGRRLHRDVTLIGQRRYILAVIEHATRRIRVLGMSATRDHRALGRGLGDPGREGSCDGPGRRNRQGQVPSPGRDAKFPVLFERIVADAGIVIVLTGARMPRMNSIIERRVQTCRPRSPGDARRVRPDQCQPTIFRVRGRKSARASFGQRGLPA